MHGKHVGHDRKASTRPESIPLPRLSVQDPTSANLGKLVEGLPRALGSERLQELSMTLVHI